MKPYTLFKRRGGDRDTAIYYVRVMENGRRKAYSTGCTKKDDAEDYAELHFGSGKRAPTLDAFLEDRHFFERGACRWIQRREAGGHELTDNTLRVYLHALAMIKKAFGRSARLKDLEIWILGLSCVSSTKSVIMSVLRVLVREAVREELIKEDPTKQLDPLKVKRQVRGVFRSTRRSFSRWPPRGCAIARHARSSGGTISARSAPSWLSSRSSSGRSHTRHAMRSPGSRIGSLEPFQELKSTLRGACWSCTRSGIPT